MVRPLPVRPPDQLYMFMSLPDTKGSVIHAAFESSTDTWEFEVGLLTAPRTLRLALRLALLALRPSPRSRRPSPATPGTR